MRGIMTLFHEYLKVPLCHFKGKTLAANYNTRVRYRIEFLYRQTQTNSRQRLRQHTAQGI